MSKQTIDAYNRRASRYEKNWKCYLDHTHHVFLDRIETTPTDVLLDLSAGTGLLAEELLNEGYPFKKLILNDPSENMLEIAHARLPDHASISFTNFKVDKLSFEEGSIDAFFCLNAFHFYPNQPQVLGNIYQILNPGGRLYLLDWNRVGLFMIVNQVIDWFSSDYIDTRSLGELKQMLNESGFKIQSEESWNWRYWKFLFIEVKK